MATKNYVDHSLPAVDAAWLNDVDAVTYEKVQNVTTVSPFMATVLDDTTAADARSNLGIPDGVAKNRIINGNFNVNQRVYVSGATVGTGLYGHDRWKMAASGDTYTFSTTANVTTVTIPAGKVLRQVVEGLNLETGTYTLSWSGTAQGKVGGGAYGASGVTGSITGGVDTTIEFGPGTLSKVQLEFGSVVTPFEQRNYGAELALCQRYYFRWGSVISAWRFDSYAIAGNDSTFNFIFPVSMRAAPTSIMVGTPMYSAGVSGGNLAATSPVGGFYYHYVSSTGTGSSTCSGTSNYFSFTAEL